MEDARSDAKSRASGDKENPAKQQSRRTTQELDGTPSRSRSSKEGAKASPKVEEDKDYSLMEETGALRIQSAARGRQARKEVEEKKKKIAEEDTKKPRRSQSGSRGSQDESRERSKSARRSKKDDEDPDKARRTSKEKETDEEKEKRRAERRRDRGKEVVVTLTDVSGVASGTYTFARKDKDMFTFSCANPRMTLEYDSQGWVLKDAAGAVTKNSKGEEIKSGNTFENTPAAKGIWTINGITVAPGESMLKSKLEKDKEKADAAKAGGSKENPVN